MPVLLITIFIVSLFYMYFKNKFQYWKKRKVPYLQPYSPLGNIPIFSKTKNSKYFTTLLYEKIKNYKWKHCGLYFFTEPVYMVLDLDYIKNILVKDFDYFDDRGFYYNENDDPLSVHLVSLSGKRWRNLRTHLNPAFTPTKMKKFFPITERCVDNLLDAIRVACDKNYPLLVQKIVSCFTFDTTAAFAFGLEFNTFVDENSPFYHHLDKCLKFSTFTNLLSRTYPKFFNKFRFKMTPKDSSKFLFKMIEEIMKMRQENNYCCEDIMQVLINLKNDDKVLKFEEVAAQCYILFLAGFEISASVANFVLYETARNQHVQNKLREEINTVLNKYEGKIYYESVMEMKYLDQIINETLRKYPTDYFITRRCVKNYKAPDEDFVIEKGTLVLISTQGIHYDEEYFPEPEKFDPERFNQNETTPRHSYTHIPFGEGPRTCIGKRLALMQIKLALAAIFKKFRLTLNPRTVDPLSLSLDTMVVTPGDEIWVDVSLSEN